MLESGGEGVAEELTAPVEEKPLADVENGADGGMRGLPLELGGEIESHLDDLTLQGRLGRLGSF
jgi:hypothetical protein